MTLFQMVVSIFVCVVLVYQLWVSRLLYRAVEYDRRQRSLQLLLVWVVPLVGAFICQRFLRNDRKRSKREDTAFAVQPPNDAGPMD